MISTRMKQAIAAGLIGVTALTSVAVLPNIADAQDEQTQTQEERQADREERQAAREARRAERSQLLSDVLGITTDALQEAREAGQSLAEVATAEGVAVQDVVDAIVDAKTEHIQEHVAAGDLTQAEADERIAGLEERVTEKVNAAPGEGRGHRGHRGPKGDAPAA